MKWVAALFIINLASSVVQSVLVSAISVLVDCWLGGL